jgi:hypothetical protein
MFISEHPSAAVLPDKNPNPKPNYPTNTSVTPTRNEKSIAIAQAVNKRSWEVSLPVR